MKKILLSITFLAAIGLSAGIASDKDVSPVVLEIFQKQFGYAHDVSWTVAENYYKATFTVNDQIVFVFFNMNDELVSVTRYLSSLQLPIHLFSDLKNNYLDYWISDVFEVNNKEGINYYVQLENNETILIMKSTNGSSWKNHIRKKKIIK